MHVPGKKRAVRGGRLEVDAVERHLGLMNSLVESNALRDRKYGAHNWRAAELFHRAPWLIDFLKGCMMM